MGKGNNERYDMAMRNGEYDMVIRNGLQKILRKMRILTGKYENSI